MSNSLKSLALGLAGATCLVGAASAAGFSRGTADTDILYDDADFAQRSGVVIVSPQRKYETIDLPNSAIFGGAAGTTIESTDGVYSDSFVIPSFAVKLNLTDGARCAGTYTQSFGAAASYGADAIWAGQADGTGLVRRQFDANEWGLTCAYKFDNVGSFGDMGQGRLFLIGGVFMEDFTYAETVRFNRDILDQIPGIPDPVVDGLAATDGTLTFDGDYELGYRVGVGYEIPQIAARVQLLYRSQVTHRPSGEFLTVVDTLVGGSGVSNGRGTLPQSLELKAQTGVAAGTLVFGSVKWTDWSVLQTLDYTISGGPLPGARKLEFFWKDSWTVSAGVARQFNDWIGGSLSLIWDKGVSTTEDVYTDTWTLASGIAFTGERAELRLGGALSYLTSGSVAGEVNPAVGGEGNTFGYTVGDDLSYTVGGSFSVKW